MSTTATQLSYILAQGGSFRVSQFNILLAAEGKSDAVNEAALLVRTALSLYEVNYDFIDQDIQYRLNDQYRLLSASYYNLKAGYLHEDEVEELLMYAARLYKAADFSTTLQ